MEGIQDDDENINEEQHSCSYCSQIESDNHRLRLCGRCSHTRYCNIECQRADWKAHKKQCGVVEHLFAMGVDNEEDETTTQAAKRVSKSIKKAVKSGMPIMAISETAFGIVGPGFPLPTGVPRNFALKQEATMQLQRGCSSSGKGLGNKRGEMMYRDYYDDICVHEQEWMDFFDPAENYIHAEHTCGILGTLATIYRQRGALKECEQVLDMEDKVLVRYGRHCEACSIREQINCYQGLKHKARIIRYNMCFQQERYEEDCIGIYRELLDYEFKRNLTFEEQEYLFMIPCMLHKKPTAKLLKKLTDNEIMKLVLAPLQLNNGQIPSHMFSNQEEVRLKFCANCQVEERALRQHKACTRCKATFYCDRECQVGHWPEHKQSCQQQQKKKNNKK
mmetsp:Transcript_41214/g.44747  ORF Transcript_41214/g.44747 Transcript_41214/m.44747 type:complete len:391 (-) Transcript_41214:1203-2375(-)